MNVLAQFLRHKTMKTKFVIGALLLSVAAHVAAQSLQFCIYNKYGQRQGGCYLDRSACENVAANYNKTNGSMGFFCQPEKK